MKPSRGSNPAGPTPICAKVGCPGDHNHEECSDQRRHCDRRRRVHRIVRCCCDGRGRKGQGRRIQGRRGPRDSHAFKGGGAKFRGGPKFHSGSNAIRYGGSKAKVAKHGRPKYEGHGKPYYSSAKKGHGKYKPYQHYGKYPYYRRYPHYAWYGVPLYSYGGGCGWLYRQAVSTGSDY